MQFSGVDPFTSEGITLHVDDGIIQGRELCDEPGLPVLSPGLIDLQVNGYNGVDLNSGTLTVDRVEALCGSLCEAGVAAYLPTLITASENDLCQRLAVIKEASETQTLSKAMIAGIHVEGPSISIKDGPRGAHPAEHVRLPSIEEFERWQRAAGGLIRLITLAPELPGSRGYISHLAKQKICVALGHCDASEEDIQRAVEAGAQMSTHLGNGIASTLPRHPNAIWAQLGEDRLSASLILDGHHLPRSTARSMIRAKGVDRVVMVSDSVMFAGMPQGKYSSPIGGEVDVSADGRVSIAGTPYLAGSGSSLLDLVRRFSAFVGFPITDAITMATRNPGRVAGLTVDLSPGERANIIVFDVDPASGCASVQDIIFNGMSVLQ